MLLLYSIAAGLLLGRLLGGRLGNLENLRFVWWQVALAGLAVQLVLFSGPVEERIGSVGVPIYVISTLAVMAALLRNMRFRGLVIIAVGAALNLIVVIANGGAMPSAPDAWLALNGVAEVPVAHFSNSVLIGPGTWFPFLGDVFVWPRPLPLANVFSIGDVIIAVGAVVFLVSAMRKPAETTLDAATDTPTSAIVPAHR
ncbi:MAG: DUF5317 domain-containing protein [Chloroflexota bacterium]